MKEYDFTPADDIQSVGEGQEQYAAHNHEMNLAWQFIASTGVSVFLTGKAGTGKTTFLRKLRELTPKRMVVLAPTGVAAINAEGQTIHSFFQLAFGPFVPGSGVKSNAKNFKMSDRKKSLIRTLDLLVIDEVSMVRADLLDQIDAVMRQYRDRTKPFGGVQLLLIGDLMQLSPVAKPDEWDLLSPYYDTQYFFSSHALKQMQYVTIELKHIYRQQDQKFVDLLAVARSGRLTKNEIDILNQRYIRDFVAEGDDWIRLTTHNYSAQQYNDRMLGLLPSRPCTFEAKVQGDFPEFSYPTDSRLVLKEGAQVMFVKNAPTPMHAYFNGKVGIINKICEKFIVVMCDNGRERIEVTPVSWENVKYAIDPDTKAIKETVAGSFTQYPLRLAWAITVHKSQGLTFDHAILDINQSFAHGQVYVALSRCRTLEGLVLSNPIYPNSLKVDSQVNEFIDRELAAEEENVRRLPEMKYRYQLTLLDELYTFRQIQMSLNWLVRVVDEYLSIRQRRLLALLKEAVPVFEGQVIGVAAKFSALYHSVLAQSGGGFSNTQLPERIKSSSAYFVEKLHDIFDNIYDEAVINIDNKQIAQTYNNALIALKENVAEKSKIFEKLQEEPFSTRNYLNFKAQVMLENATPNSKKTARPSRTAKAPAPQPINEAPHDAVDDTSSQIEKSNANKAHKRPKPSTYEQTFDIYNQGLSIAEIANQRNLKESTIYSHIAKLVSDGLIPMDDLVPPERQEKIRQAARSFTEAYTLTDIFEKLNQEYNFNEIKIVIESFRKDENRI